uniref:Uncharacterized protein n=1 Tax=Arundo donax TaxID=35708 RepID=A0A0A9C6B0_ARUDO
MLVEGGFLKEHIKQFALSSNAWHSESVCFKECQIQFKIFWILTILTCHGSAYQTYQGICH